MTELDDQDWAETSSQVPAEEDEVAGVARRLSAGPPRPGPELRAGLERRWSASRPLPRWRPENPRLVIGSSAVAGLFLFALGAIGLLGLGPLAA
jgi:hypothetical protein